MRLFIAVPLPEPIKKQLTVLSAKLKSLSSGLPIKWVKQENVHLTLKFLGDTDEQTASLIKPEIKSISGKFHSLYCKMGGLGAFPHIDRPRVFWVGLNSEDELTALKRFVTEIDQRMSSLGFQPETKPFSPHLTLGRVKVAKGKQPEQTRQEFASLADQIRTTRVDPTEFVLDRIVLFQSILKPNGPVYERLCEAELGREEFSG